jgi:hypothetical protein
MSDLTKLKKQATKAREAAEVRRCELDDAINNYAVATSVLAVAVEQLEAAEALETARELRKGKP